jgi:hypothetical protein
MKPPADTNHVMSDALHDYQAVDTHWRTTAGLGFVTDYHYCVRCGTLRETITEFTGADGWMRFGPSYFSTFGDWDAEEEPPCRPRGSVKNG